METPNPMHRLLIVDDDNDIASCWPNNWAVPATR